MTRRHTSPCFNYDANNAMGGALIPHKPAAVPKAVSPSDRQRPVYVSVPDKTSTLSLISSRRQLKQRGKPVTFLKVVEEDSLEFAATTTDQENN